MKRWISFICVLLIMALCACGSGGSSESTPTETTEKETASAAETTPAETESAQEESAQEGISMYDLRKAMLAADPSLPEMTAVSSADDKADELFAYLSDIDYSKVDGYFLAYAADGMAFEIAVVALKDAADIPELEQSLARHVEGRVNLYKSYAPEQVAPAENAEIVTSGRYAALIMCGDQAAVKTVFRDNVE